MSNSFITGLVAGLVIACCAATANRAAGTSLQLGPAQLVQAGGSDLTVPGYSVPQYVDWDNDGRHDLIVGEGGAGSPGKVRVYRNVGTSAAPLFSDYQYVQSLGSDLVVDAGGCLGVFPSVAYFDADQQKDLLLGLADGQILVYLNTGTDQAPAFDGGQPLEYGPPGAKSPIDSGYRCTLDLVDWNNDGLDDLVAGGLDARIRLYLNEGSLGAPEFLSQTIVQSGGSDLLVPGDRSSPVIVDLDGDGKKDLLSGNTEGQILLYSNQGTDQAPVFSDYHYVAADDVQIDLPGMPRSRPSVIDWTGDGLPDLLVGSGDGAVRLYESLSTVPPVPLQAGDANQNLSFDQVDLIQVLEANKYNTGLPATWGEGDWNGAPGGSPGDPPAGDGHFDHWDIMAALRAGTWMTGPYGALGDPVPAGVEPVPEPSSWMLASLALLALAAAWRR
jgi:hypothetical protein